MRTAVLCVAAAATGFGLLPVIAEFTLAAGTPPQLVAWARYAIPFIVVIPWMTGGISIGPLIWALASGSAMGLGFYCYLESLRVVSVATVAVVHMSYPAWTLVLGFLLFKTCFTLREFLASLVIVAAAYIAIDADFNALEAGLDVMVVLIPPVALAFSINVLTCRIAHLPVLTRIAWTSLGGLLVLTPGLWISSAEIAAVQLWLMVLPVVALGFTAQLLYSRFAPVLGAGPSAIISSLELPAAFIGALVLLDQPIQWPHVVSAALIAMGLLAARRPAAKTARDR